MLRSLIIIIILICLMTACGKKNDPVYQSFLFYKKDFINGIY